jgi:phage gpG-like protein
MIKIDGRTIAPLRRKIHAMRDRATNLIPAWDVLIDWFADQERLQFGQRGARWRKLWPELAEGTVADKRAAGYTGDILIRETDLLRSLTDRPLSIERMSAREATAGTRIPYARFHQDGTKRMRPRVLIDAGVIAEEEAASRAVISWITKGEPHV